MSDLGSAALTWRRFGVLVRQLPAHARVVRAEYPELEWGPTEHLLASVFDALQVGNWQRAQDKHAARPQPLPRPGAAVPAVGLPTADERLRAVRPELFDGGE